MPTKIKNPNKNLVKLEDEITCKKLKLNYQASIAAERDGSFDLSLIMNYTQQGKFIGKEAIREFLEFGLLSKNLIEILEKNGSKILKRQYENENSNSYVN